MKTSVSIALIIVGFFLIALPCIRAAIGAAQVVDLAQSAAQGKSATLDSPLPEYYDGLCAICGVISLAVGAVGGCLRRNRTNQKTIKA